MSVSTLAHPKSRTGVGKLWLGILILIAAGVALAWLGAGSLRGETTASGLVFRTVEAGSGAFIKPVDGVLIEYEGRLVDGTVFHCFEVFRFMQILVRDNNVDQALRALKKKLQREGVYREMKLRRHYEKPSEKRAREKAAAVRRARKLERKRLERDGAK